MDLKVYKFESNISMIALENVFLLGPMVEQL